MDIKQMPYYEYLKTILCTSITLSISQNSVIVVHSYALKYYNIIILRHVV